MKVNMRLKYTILACHCLTLHSQSLLKEDVIHQKFKYQVRNSFNNLKHLKLILINICFLGDGLELGFVDETNSFDIQTRNAGTGELVSDSTRFKY